jgi:hypothetical protein
VDTEDSTTAIVNRGIFNNSFVSSILPTPLIFAVLKRNNGNLSSGVTIQVNFTQANPYPILNGGAIVLNVPKD